MVPGPGLHLWVPEAEMIPEQETNFTFEPLCQNPHGPDGVDCVFPSPDKSGVNGKYSPSRESPLALYLYSRVPYAWGWAEGEAFARIALLRAF